MAIEIDQSGKLEQLDTDTVLACANDTSRVVYIKAGTKRKIVTYLRKSLIPRKDLYPIVFALAVFILIQPVKQTMTLKIDEEYTGKEEIIKETLEKLIKRHMERKGQGMITFGRIGKHASAHQLAWRVHRTKQRSEVKRITEDQLLKLLF
ncbi:hypothetical protein HY008_02880 [Candidatus Woesebacteria bacterium]|nr:hypothetical protein [Candidatus Woesebacteria bacterium]